LEKAEEEPELSEERTGSQPATAAAAATALWE